MGTDSTLVCLDCQESLSAGDDYKFWDEDKVVDFMIKHKGHLLTYLDDGNWHDALIEIENFEETGKYVKNYDKNNPIHQALRKLGHIAELESSIGSKVEFTLQQLVEALADKLFKQKLAKMNSKAKIFTGE